MSKMTFVVEFEDGKEPPVHAGMDVLGGKLTAVAFSDAITRLNELEEEMQDAAYEHKEMMERYDE